jgi:hypothetical protein
MTGDVLEAYVEQFVCPELRPGDVVVVDNLGAHKRAAVGALVENAKASIRFLMNDPSGSKITLKSRWPLFSFFTAAPCQNDSPFSCDGRGGQWPLLR